MEIKKEDFSFGKSLNVGCNFSNGDYLVFVSGHCIPVDNHWLENLVSPLEDNCGYTYGKQIGRGTTKFSENQLFKKYFPDQLLAYNCSPSFNWKKNLNDSDIAKFQIELGAMGYKYQFNRKI